MKGQSHQRLKKGNSGMSAIKPGFSDVTVRRIVALGLILAFLSPSVTFARCRWWKDLLGICSAGERIGLSIERSAAELGDSVFASFNYWAKLIQDYHAGTDEERKRARVIIEKVFGL